jgi:GAF domain-containing protein
MFRPPKVGVLAVLRAVSRALARPLDTTDVLRAVHGELSHALDATICFFGLYDARAETVHVIWQIHEGLELPGGHFPLGSGPTSQAIRDCRPRLIRRWSDEGPRVQVQYATDRPGLPESCIAVPVIFDGSVVGVLAIQAYQAEAYDDADVMLMQGVADQVATALMLGRRASARRESLRARSANPQLDSVDSEAVLASMADALLVLDDQRRLVRINRAARSLLSSDDGSSLILGYPVDQSQEDRWPLGTRALTEQLAPIVEQLRGGATPRHDVRVALDGQADHSVSCRASVLMREGSPAGAVVVLRELSAAKAS